MKEKYAIFPEQIEEGTGIIDKFYGQMCLLNFLQNKHKFVPEVKYRSLAMLDFKFNKYKIVPDSLSREDLTLLSLFGEDEVKDFLQDINILINDNKYKQEKHDFKNIYRFLIHFNQKYSEISKDHLFNDYLNISLPIPVFSDQKLYTGKAIIAKLADNHNWIMQLIDFFDFLTEELIFIERLKPEDFLYDERGNIKYFLSYNRLKFKSDSENLLKNNMNSLAYLLFSYYIADISYQGRLYSQKYFEKLEGRLIEPLIYNKSSEGFYENFQDIKNDLTDNLNYKPSQKRIGVFLDTANIFKVMDYGSTRMRIRFDKLLTSIYGRFESRKIIKKIAVVFLPEYKDEKKTKNTHKIINNIKEYLEEDGFEVFEVKNGTPHPKQIVDGEETDVDDQKLIEMIENSYEELDSILLLTGDKHFFDIVSKYKDTGKEVKLISLTEDSTYQGFTNNFDHQYIYDYWDCINLNFIKNV